MPVRSAVYAGKADASLFNEASQVVLVRDGERTVLSMLNDYSGPAQRICAGGADADRVAAGQVRVAERPPSNGSMPIPARGSRIP